MTVYEMENNGKLINAGIGNELIALLSFMERKPGHLSIFFGNSLKTMCEFINLNKGKNIKILQNKAAELGMCIKYKVMYDDIYMPGHYFYIDGAQYKYAYVIKEGLLYNM